LINIVLAKSVLILIHDVVINKEFIYVLQIYFKTWTNFYFYIY